MFKELLGLSEVKTKKINIIRKGLEIIKRRKHDAEASLLSLMRLLRMELKDEEKDLKEVIDRINGTIERVEHEETLWQLKILKVKLALKVVQKKLNHDINFKFHNTLKNVCILKTIFSKANHTTTIQSKIINIGEFYSYIEDELEALSSQYLYHQINPKTSPDKIFLIEEIVLCYLILLNTKAYHMEKLKKPIESFSFLIIATKLIKEYYRYIRNPKVLLEAEKVYIRLIKIYLLNHDFELAMDYIKLCVKTCIRDLLIRNEFYLIKTNTKKNVKTFINLAICLSYMGYSCEITGRISMSVFCYKQAGWFSNKYIRLIPYISFNKKFISPILETAKGYLKAYDMLKEYERKVIRRRIQKKKEMLYERRKATVKFLELKEKKFKKMQNELNRYKIPEICQYRQLIDENKYLKDKKEQNDATKKIRMVNNFLKDDLKNVVSMFPKINFYDVDERTKIDIEDALFKHKIEKHLEKEEKEKEKSSIKNMRRSQSSLGMEGENSLVENFKNNDERESKNKRNSCGSSININRTTNINMSNKEEEEEKEKKKGIEKKQEKRKMYKTNPNEIKKYKITNLVENPTTYKKRAFLVRIFDKEVEYHMRVLKLKKEEPLLENDNDIKYKIKKVEFDCEMKKKQKKTLRFKSTDDKEQSGKRDTVFIQSSVNENRNKQKLKANNNFTADEMNMRIEMLLNKEIHQCDLNRIKKSKQLKGIRFRRAKSCNDL